MLKKTIKRREIGSINGQRGRSGKLLVFGNDFQYVVRPHRLAFGQEPSQCSVDQLQAFVLGSVQQLEVLFDGRLLRRPLEELVVGHAECGRRVHVIDVLVINKRARFADQRVDDVAKVDRLLAVTKLSGHPLETFAAIPKFQMVLVDPHFQVQADVLAADRVRITFDPNDAIRLDGQEHRRTRAASLRRQRTEHRELLGEAFLAIGIAATEYLADERHVVVHVGEVSVTTKSQGLIECILEVAVRRLNVSVLMRLADIDSMSPGAVVC